MYIYNSDRQGIKVHTVSLEHVLPELPRCFQLFFSQSAVRPIKGWLLVVKNYGYSF